MGDEEKIEYSFEGDISSLKKASESAMSLLDKFGKAAKSVATTVTKAFASLTGVQLGDWLTEATQQSIDYTETLNLFNVAMGDAVDVGNEFISSMAEIYGMDPSNLMRYAGNFYQLADAVDTSTEAAQTMSLGLTKAANDISSLFNVPIDQVFDNLSSGMQGASRAVRKYGMDIRLTTLQQTALSLGITDTVATMSEANRQGLRFITMTQQAENASGDFARTIESPANQLKIFKEQMSQLGRAIGDLFIEPLTVAIQHINGFVMALRLMITFVGSVLGIVKSATEEVADSSEDAEDYITSIGTAASGTTKKLKAMLAPFDELNVLSSKPTTSDLGGTGTSDIMDPAILEYINNMELGLENIRMKALDVRDTLLTFLGFTIDAGSIISWDITAFEENVRAALPILNTLEESYAVVAQHVQVMWTQMMSVMGDALNAVVDRWGPDVQRILDGFMEALMHLGEIVMLIWTGYVAPVIEFVGSNIGDLWTNELQPICASIIDIILSIAEIILILWNDALAPLITWLLQTFSPLFLSAFEGAWEGLKAILQSIGDALAGFENLLNGLITFLTGVFSGDWEKAWEGLVEIFAGVWLTIEGVVKTVFNTIILLVNGVLGGISAAINGIIWAINQISFEVPEWVPGLGGQTLGFSLDYVEAWQIPYLASGGVVTSPTMAMVGEGKYDEAVIPLGNSPQMRELVSSIADAVSGAGGSSDQPIVVHLYLDGKEVLDTVVRQARSEAVRTGINPLLGG